MSFFFWLDGKKAVIIPKRKFFQSKFFKQKIVIEIFFCHIFFLLGMVGQFQVVTFSQFHLQRIFWVFSHKSDWENKSSGVSIFSRISKIFHFFPKKAKFGCSERVEKSHSLLIYFSEFFSIIFSEGEWNNDIELNFDILQCGNKRFHLKKISEGSGSIPNGHENTSVSEKIWTPKLFISNENSKVLIENFQKRKFIFVLNRFLRLTVSWSIKDKNLKDFFKVLFDKYGFFFFL